MNKEVDDRKDLLYIPNTETVPLYITNTYIDDRKFLQLWDID